MATTQLEYVDKTVKPTVREAMESLGFSVAELARQANVSLDTVYHMINTGDKVTPHQSSAQSIAGALHLKVDEIDWPKGITTTGRPAGTGVPCHVTRKQMTACDTCGIELPLSGTCDTC